MLLGGSNSCPLLITQIWGRNKRLKKLDKFIFYQCTTLRIHQADFLCSSQPVCCPRTKQKKICANLPHLCLPLQLFFVLQKGYRLRLFIFHGIPCYAFLRDVNGFYTAASAGAAIGGPLLATSLFHISDPGFGMDKSLEIYNPQILPDKQSLFAVATGGLIGTGLYLGDPEIHTCCPHRFHIFSIM